MTTLTLNSDLIVDRIFVKGRQMLARVDDREFIVENPHGFRIFVRGKATFMLHRPWDLEDVEQRSASHPLFQIPTLKERNAINSGDVVKLIFRQEDRKAGERMWVRVTALDHGPHYFGKLESHPVTIKGIEHGESVTFEPRHVAAIKPAPKGST